MRFPLSYPLRVYISLCVFLFFVPSVSLTFFFLSFFLSHPFVHGCSRSGIFFFMWIKNFPNSTFIIIAFKRRLSVTFSSSLSLSLSLSHTHTYTYAHTCTNSHMRKSSHNYTLACSIVTTQSWLSYTFWIFTSFAILLSFVNELIRQDL